MIVRQVGFGAAINLSNVSRSMKRWRALTLAVGIFTSANGFSSMSLCLRATWKKVRAKANRFATVAAASACVSSHALNWSHSPGVTPLNGLSSPKNSVRLRQGCCHTSSVAGFTSGRERMYSFRNAPRTARLGASTNPTAASRSRSFAPIPVSQAAVSLGMDCPPIFAPNRASTYRQTLSALLRSHLPSRIVFRLSSGATKIKMAVTLLKLMPSPLAPEDAPTDPDELVRRIVDERRENVRTYGDDIIDRDRGLPGYEDHVNQVWGELADKLVTETPEPSGRQVSAQIDVQP